MQLKDLVFGHAFHGKMIDDWGRGGKWGDVCADNMRVFGCEDEAEAIDYVKAKLA